MLNPLLKFQSPVDVVADNSYFCCAKAITASNDRIKVKIDFLIVICFM